MVSVTEDFRWDVVEEETFVRTEHGLPASKVYLGNVKDVALFVV